MRMRSTIRRMARDTAAVGAVLAGSSLAACSSAEHPGGGQGGGTSASSGTSGGTSGSSGAIESSATGGEPVAAAGSGGTSAVTMGGGGSTSASAGAPSATGGAGGNARGGAGQGGRGGSDSASGQAGALTAGGSAGAPPAGGCTIAPFPTADPTVTGPFSAMTENNVGADGTYTMFRPSDLTEGGLCHPLITWGNGHGTTPTLYARFLTHLASHGFVVIASNSSTVSMGDPPPMIAGVDWVLAQNADPTSELYQTIDTTHIGATGHSEGAFATVSAAADARITVVAPIEGASASRNYHGPALLLCGGMDTTVGCDGAMSAFNAITSLPAMYASQLAATHTNWMVGGGPGAALNPFMIAVTGWMRVHLMSDEALKPMFYGPDCTLCKDTATWDVLQKNLD